jgi:hypothetical protein
MQNVNHLNHTLRRLNMHDIQFKLIDKAFTNMININ